MHPDVPPLRPIAPRARLTHALLGVLLIGASTASAKPLPSDVVRGEVFAYCFAGDADLNTVYMTKLFRTRLPRAPALQMEFKAYLRAHYPAPGPNTPRTWSEPGCFADPDTASLAAYRGVRAQEAAGTYGAKLIEPDWRPTP